MHSDRENTEEHSRDEEPQGIARPWLLLHAATSAPSPPPPASLLLHCWPPVSNIVQAKAATPGLGCTMCRTQAKYGLLKHVQFEIGRLQAAALGGSHYTR